MRRFVITLAAVGFGLVVASASPVRSETAAPAAGSQKGTVTAVEEEVVRFKGPDGKEYEIDSTVVAAENLKTGDIVEYGVVNEKPVRVKKSK